jgi:hypothetical protein
MAHIAYILTIVFLVILIAIVTVIWVDTKKNLTTCETSESPYCPRYTCPEPAKLKTIGSEAFRCKNGKIILGSGKILDEDCPE